MNAFLPLKEEEVLKRASSLTLTNKRIVQQFGTSDNMTFNTIAIKNIGAMSLSKKSYKSYLMYALAFGGLSFIIFLLDIGFYNNRKMILIGVSFLASMYFIWKYYSSRKSNLFIYSKSQAVMGQEVTSSNSYEIIQIMQMIDQLIVK